MNDNKTKTTTDPPTKFTHLLATDLFSVRGKVALITGGSRGVGFMMAQGLVANGAHVIITSRNAKQCAAACDMLNHMARSLPDGIGGSCVFIVQDVGTEQGCRAVIEKVQEMASEKTVGSQEQRNARSLQQGIHILVNNAGTNWAESIETYPDSAWDKVLALNVKSVFHMTRFALPLLKHAAQVSGESSSVINTGSINGINAPSNMETYAYSTSKAAVHHLTRHLASQLASQHIRVNCIALGIVHTKMTHETLENFGDVIVESVPLRRTGRVEDLSAIVLYLGSKASSWMTGALIPLDGGALVNSHI